MLQIRQITQLQNLHTLWKNIFPHNKKKKRNITEILEGLDFLHFSHTKQNYNITT